MDTLGSAIHFSYLNNGKPPLGCRAIHLLGSIFSACRFDDCCSGSGDFLPGATAFSNDQLGIHDDAPRWMDPIFNQVDQDLDRFETEVKDWLVDGGQLGLGLDRGR